MNGKKAKALRKLIGYTAPTMGSYDVEDKGVKALPYTPKRYNLLGEEVFFRVQRVQVRLKRTTKRALYQSIKRKGKAYQTT